MSNTVHPLFQKYPEMLPVLSHLLWDTYQKELKEFYLVEDKSEHTISKIKKDFSSKDDAIIQSAEELVTLLKNGYKIELSVGVYEIAKNYYQLPETHLKTLYDYNHNEAVSDKRFKLSLLHFQDWIELIKEESNPETLRKIVQYPWVFHLELFKKEHFSFLIKTLQSETFNHDIQVQTLQGFLQYGGFNQSQQKMIKDMLLVNYPNDLKAFSFIKDVDVYLQMQQSSDVFDDMPFQRQYRLELDCQKIQHYFADLPSKTALDKCKLLPKQFCEQLQNVYADEIVHWHVYHEETPSHYKKTHLNISVNDSCNLTDIVIKQWFNDYLKQMYQMMTLDKKNTIFTVDMTDWFSKKNLYEKINTHFEKFKNESEGSEKTFKL
jgi:hypothetical protein